MHFGNPVGVRGPCLIHDPGIAQHRPDPNELGRFGGGFGCEDRARLQETRGPVADHLQRREDRGDPFFIVGDRVIEGAVDRVEHRVRGHVVGDRAAMQLVGRVEVPFDQPWMHRRALCVDDAPAAKGPGDLGVRPHADDPPAVDGDRAVLDERARVVHRDQVGVANHQVGSAC